MLKSISLSLVPLYCTTMMNRALNGEESAWNRYSRDDGWFAKFHVLLVTLLECVKYCSPTASYTTPEVEATHT